MINYSGLEPEVRRIGLQLLLECAQSWTLAIATGE